ncbi:hypothetical protein HanIR_Chr10g0461331 [Helianthus annuus]|nr:hypothetical protein HanIR_Chr10g0461331 [Helianthus annuus]
MVIPEGALVMTGMSLLWRDSWLYLAFQRVDKGEWSLFDFVDPPRNAALRPADRVIGEQEPDVLRIHLKQFMLPAIPADPSAYVSQPHPGGGSIVSVAETKKPTRVKITGRKVMTAGATTSPVAVPLLRPKVRVCPYALDIWGCCVFRCRWTKPFRPYIPGECCRY